MHFPGKEKFTATYNEISDNCSKSCKYGDFLKYWLQSFRKLLCECFSNKAKEKIKSQDGVVEVGARTRAS